MSKNKTPHPYIYQRFDKPSKWDWIEGAQWQISRLEWLRLHGGGWMPSPYEYEDNHAWQKGFGWDMPRIGSLRPTGYNCHCVLDYREAIKPKPILSEKELLRKMRLSLILIKGSLLTWERFFELYPLALDYIEIRLAYQDYIIGLILKAPSRLWHWLKGKKK